MEERKQTILQQTKPYLLGTAATLLAWWLDLLLEDFLSEGSGAFFIAAALIAAWYGGLRAGIASVVLTVALNLIFYDHPFLSLAVGVHGFEKLTIFSTVSLVVAWLTARSRRSEELLRDLNHQLEEQVRKRTEALAESNRQLESFCYTLAHDLRSPLRAIEGFAHLVIADSGATLDAEARGKIERIRRSAERMGRLILDLLAYTDLTRATFRRQPVDLEEISRTVLRLFADEIEQTNAEVIVKLPVNKAVGDAAGVERVLTHFLGNALKFAHPQRRLRIEIFSERKTSRVRLNVCDNGVGIEPKYEERIFGVFQQLNGREHTVGTGIGLAIAKRSVEKMGGSIGVDSTPGNGSCFWFELPEIS